MNHYEKTLTHLNRVINHEPSDTKALAHRGEIYHQTKHYQEALADFNRAIELNPNYAWAIAHRGETYRQMACYEEALANFDQAIGLKANYAWAIAHRGVTYRHKGHVYLDKALSDLNRAIELAPDYAWAIVQRVNVYVMMRRYEEALADAARAIALDQNIVPHWQAERGLLLNYLGRYAETIVCCEQALHENPNDHNARYSLAVAKACWKGVNEAKTEIDETRVVLQSIVNTGERAVVLYRLGSLAALQGKADQALDYLQEAIFLGGEPREMVHHDPAWSELRDHPRFQLLIADTISKCQD